MWPIFHPSGCSLKFFFYPWSSVMPWWHSLLQVMFCFGYVLGPFNLGMAIPQFWEVILYSHSNNHLPSAFLFFFSLIYFIFNLFHFSLLFLKCQLYSLKADCWIRTPRAELSTWCVCHAGGLLKRFPPSFSFGSSINQKSWTLDWLLTFLLNSSSSPRLLLVLLVCMFYFLGDFLDFYLLILLLKLIFQSTVSILVKSILLFFFIASYSCLWIQYHVISKKTKVSLVFLFGFLHFFSCFRFPVVYLLFHSLICVNTKNWIFDWMQISVESGCQVCKFVLVVLYFSIYLDNFMCMF